MVSVSTAIFPLGTYGPGSVSFGPVAVARGVSSIKLAFDRTNLLDATASISFSVEFSFDGGATWSGADPAIPYRGVAATASGGTILDGDGVTILESSISIAVPQPNNSQRRARGTLSVNKAILTAGTLTVS